MNCTFLGEELGADFPTYDNTSLILAKPAARGSTDPNSFTKAYCCG